MACAALTVGLQPSTRTCARKLLSDWPTLLAATSAIVAAAPAYQWCAVSQTWFGACRPTRSRARRVRGVRRGLWPDVRGTR